MANNNNNTKGEEEQAGMEAINKLKSTDPPLFLSPNPDLSLSTRLASQYVFASLKPYSPKSPFDHLLTDGFDAEQIWQQIDIQSQPLLSSLKREISVFEKNPDQISKLFGTFEVNEENPDGKSKVFGGIEENGVVGLGGDSEDDVGSSDVDESGEDDVEEEEEDEDEEEDDGDGVPEVEDEFLKIKELQKYLSREERREYGSEENANKKKKKKRKGEFDDDDEEEGEDDEDESEEDEDDDDELMYAGGDDDEDGMGGDIRYEDFFVPNKNTQKRKPKQVGMSEDSDMENDNANQKEENLSTFEKERAKIQAQIKMMEEENLRPKEWTMQGEVTAAKRPKDSALEVELDFEHNVRPPPVITEEVTASLEEIIKKRISEANFDDVQRAPKFPSAAPREKKELDDNKSKKGLAEVYEEQYAQQTGLASAPVSFNDELKKEASNLFKRLCLKLDALSHFHFAPKPVVEDMSVQTNVPALAMEEIAPVAVSEAAMLAPEEVFAGKGDIKEETELTKEDRKRRRAKKKRIVKARNAKKPLEKPLPVPVEGKDQ